jgi:hypothetical protein
MIGVTFTSVNDAGASLVVQDFENIPDTYLHSNGDQNLGGYLPGLFFGSYVTVLDKVRSGPGYNYISWPPHSGNAVIFSTSSSVPDSIIRVDFLGSSKPDYVEAWYTSPYSPLYMDAYDASDTLLCSTSQPANIGTNILISVSHANIAYVKFHDSGSCFTVDDLAYTPEPATICLFGLGALSLIRRKK